MSQVRSEAEKVMQRIFQLFQERGDACYGEEITQREHALQCALLAARAGDPPELVVACLLHDVGHLLGGNGAPDLDSDVHLGGLAEADAERDDEANTGDKRDLLHEERGARWLQRYFPPEVTEPIRLHVAAKRYLCWRDPAYHVGLSRASQRSLRLQGGPMTETEARQFELHPQFRSALRLREYDDQGKIPGLQLPELVEYADQIRPWVR